MPCGRAITAAQARERRQGSIAASHGLVHRRPASFPLPTTGLAISTAVFAALNGYVRWIMSLLVMEEIYQTGMRRDPSAREFYFQRLANGTDPYDSTVTLCVDRCEELRLAENPFLVPNTGVFCVAPTATVAVLNVLSTWSVLHVRVCGGREG